MTSRYRYIRPGLARGELAATTRADLQDSGDRPSELAEQQAALRRVATLVGRGVSSSEVFAAVADETARCLHADNTSVNRFEGNEVVVLATHLEPRVKDKLVVGQRFPLGGDDIVTRVFRTGRAARMDASESQNAPGAIAANVRDMELGCTMGFPIVVNGRVWGIISVGAHTPEQLPPNPQERLSEFAELITTAIANAAARDALGELAEQQAALRRVATLVARGVSPSEVFAAVAEELAHCLGVKNAGLFRYESGGAVLVAACDPAPTHWPVGDRRTLEGDNIPALVLRTGRAVRMNSFENAAGSIAARARELGICGAVGVPIVVDGRLWGGAYVASMTSEPLPPDTEERMTDFADLVATALANAATRDALRELAEQQAALRRVATLVARGVSPSEVFAAVADEVGRCLNVDNVAVGRFDDDEVAVVALARIDPGVKNPLLVGERSTLDGDNVATRVLRTGRAARLDRSESEGAAGPVAERFREMELGCTVGVPIVVDGRLWGVAGVGSTKGERMPADIEVRLGDFAELVATAIANAATHDDLIASRARIVAAADDARRRIERDLHDGAQQRLISLGLQLRLAEVSVPPELRSLKEQLSDVVSGLTAASSELQQISRGIHPAILSEGGLGPALKTLARRCPVPVTVDVAVERRLPDPVEVAAYYVVAEALTNAAKYAHACAVKVCAETKGTSLCLSIQDDGAGGANCRKGSGLIGLKDRVEALGGHLQIASPRGSGTSLHVTIPVTSGSVIAV